ncbi:MAG: CarD family transcriptional regulator [Deltaproteobacteria bacterium]|nr:CarD family transcriptional regulator [Deltaproteobacteria bacterium]MBF0510668.1 CarD family transcriptional regulator [Deltaproteobacteria bacterium]MBF0552479.1 CarD family transcriptional regulator [Deltaproteobacteria bacterium]
MFKVGELAVYPAHGVGVIQSIEYKEISGFDQEFLIMRILENDMIIMIPTTSVQNVGLRQVIDEGQVPRVYDILREKNMDSETQSWNRRYREYMEKIKTGSVFEVAAVLRDLFALKEDKELSFGERKMFDTARSLLVKELSIAKRTEEAVIENDIMNIFQTYSPTMS